MILFYISLVIGIIAFILLLASIVFLPWLMISGTDFSEIFSLITAPFTEWYRIRHAKDTGEIWLSLDQLVSFSQAFPEKWEFCFLEEYGYAFYYMNSGKGKGGSEVKIHVRRRDIKKFNKMMDRKNATAEKSREIALSVTALNAMMKDAAKMKAAADAKKEQAVKEQQEIFDRWVREYKSTPIKLTLDPSELGKNKN